MPPIDEQVISMKLVTPGKGTIEVSREKDPELFYLARCGLGGLGVVSEVTLQCVERQELVEHTYVSNIKDIKKNHKYIHSLSMSITNIFLHKAHGAQGILSHSLVNYSGLNTSRNYISSFHEPM